MPYHEGKELVLAGLASWINRCKGIRLNFTPVTVLRGRSCNISEQTILKYLELLGTKRARGITAAIESWKFHEPIVKAKLLNSRVKGVSGESARASGMLSSVPLNTPDMRDKGIGSI